MRIFHLLSLSVGYKLTPFQETHIPKWLSKRSSGLYFSTFFWFEEFRQDLYHNKVQSVGLFQHVSLPQTHKLHPKAYAFAFCKYHYNSNLLSDALLYVPRRAERNCNEEQTYPLELKILLRSNWGQLQRMKTQMVQLNYYCTYWYPVLKTKIRLL